MSGAEARPQDSEAPQKVGCVRVCTEWARMSLARSSLVLQASTPLLSAAGRCSWTKEQVNFKREDREI